MEEKNAHINQLLEKIAGLEEQIFEANNLMDAIRDGSIDAFVLNKEGRSDIYALESIDYTYRILIEKFGEGALSISQEGLILYCNSYFSSLLRLPISKIMGTYFQSYVSSEDAFNALMTALKTGLSKGELSLKSEGRSVPVYISLTSLQPYLPAIGVIVTDQTQNKQHEAEIYQYQKDLEQKINELRLMNNDLEQFVHIISHDIKEPLRKIVSYGGRLKQELKDGFNEKGLKHLNIIYEATLRLNLLVDDLVQYSFAAQSKSSFGRVSLMKTVAEVLNDTEVLIREKGATIQVSDLPEIFGSEVQMRQLFSNLIINAIKYAKQDQPPIIHIAAQTVDRESVDTAGQIYRITISDNGIGIEEQYLQKIFTIFQRLHAQHEYSGTGIGLAICKKIMENHSGKIEVESTPGKGSKFSLYLPSL